MRVLLGEVARGRRELERRLVIHRLADEEIQELRPLEPPVAEQLRVERAHHDRRHIHILPQPLDLRGARAHEVPRVRIDGAERPVAMVEFLVRAAPGDAVIFQPREAPHAVRRQEVAEVFRREIEADVAVEIAIGRVARVALLRAPDLPAGVPVAPKRRRTRRGESGRVDRVTRPRIPKHDPVRIDHEPAQVRLREHPVEAGGVGAFRQPDAARVAAEGRAVVVPRDEDLRAHRLGELLHERQKAVRRRAGDDLEHAAILQRGECGDHVAMPALHVVAPALEQPVVVEARRLLQLALPRRALHLAPCQLDRALQIPLVAPVQQRVAQHVAERRRERHRELEGHPVIRQPVQHLEQRDVGFGDRLEEPVLLKELLILRVPHVGEMRVEDEG